MIEFIVEYLRGKVEKINFLSEKELNNFYEASKQYHLIGFLASIHKLSNDVRFRKFANLRRALVAKNLIMTNDLDLISNAFYKDRINFCILKGAALNKADIYEPGIRFFRDIDILVDKDDLEKAFNSLNRIGFKYKNKFCKNSCVILGKKHHLPVMSNENNTFVELHHRVTLEKIFQDCPITKNILKDKIFINNTYVPSQDGFLAHALYHGFKHQKETIGPIPLFDIQAITKKYKLNLSYQNNYIESLKMTKKMKEIKTFFDYVESENNYDNIYKRLNDIQENIVMDNIVQNQIHIFDIKKIIKRLSNNFISKKIDYIEFEYQTKRTSLNFIFLFILELLISIKKIRYL